MTQISKLAPLGALALTACFPVDVYHKTGVTLNRQNSDLVGCEATALRDAPVTIRQKRTPRYYVPARQVCRDTATGPVCHIQGGYWEGGHVYTYDANKELRAKIKEQCMVNKGYVRARLPQCSGAQISQSGGALPRMPQLTAGACVAKGVDGRWVVLAP